MIFITKGKVIDLHNLETSENVSNKVHIFVNDFLSSSLDLMAHTYLKPDFKKFKASERFSDKLNNEDELFKFDGEILARNFCVFLSIGAKIKFTFPIQKTVLEIQEGDCVVIPASYMYPFQTYIDTDGELLEVFYLFNKMSVVDTEENLSKNRSY